MKFFLLQIYDTKIKMPEKENEKMKNSIKLKERAKNNEKIDF